MACRLEYDAVSLVDVLVLGLGDDNRGVVNPLGNLLHCGCPPIAIAPDDALALCDSIVIGCGCTAIHQVYGNIFLPTRIQAFLHRRYGFPCDQARPLRFISIIRYQNNRVNGIFPPGVLCRCHVKAAGRRFLLIAAAVTRQAAGHAVLQDADIAGPVASVPLDFHG